MHAGPRWLWLAVGVAFSASIVELSRHALALPYDRISFLLASVLLIRIVLLSQGAPRSPRAGVLLLAAAAFLQFAAILGDLSTFGRASVALAVIALARLTGRPSLQGALVALWLVPIPISVVEVVREPLENSGAAIIAVLSSAFGAPAEAVGPVVRSGSTILELRVSDTGLYIGYALSLVGWYAAARRDEPLARCAASALRYGLLAVPVALAGLVLASLVLVVGKSGGAVRTLLDHVVPALVVLAALLHVELGLRRRAR